MNLFSNIYLLVFPEKGVLKIGKANNIAVRASKLIRDWGYINYSQSWALSVPTEVVSNIEISIQKLLHPYKAPFEEGDGKEEMFYSSALDTAMGYFQLYADSVNRDLTVLKEAISDEALILDKAALFNMNTLSTHYLSKKHHQLSCNKTNFDSLFILKKWISKNKHRISGVFMDYTGRWKTPYLLFKHSDGLKIEDVYPSILFKPTPKCAMHLFACVSPKMHECNHYSLEISRSIPSMLLDKSSNFNSSFCVVLRYIRFALLRQSVTKIT